LKNWKMMSSEPVSQQSASPKRTVLVVEDDILVRLTIADHLRGAGYIVFEAPNAAEAAAVFASGERVDVMFTDVQMPGAMDGLMLARWVQEHYPGTPVLVTSGKGGAAISSGVIADGAFFSKPYRLEAVANRIRSLLEQ
jgi:CheY-like chemotaxis protein